MSGDKFMLIFQSDISEMLRTHAEAEYPRECCGILLGECKVGRKTVSKLVQTENTASNTAHFRHFQINPLAVAKAEQEHEPLEILGFYHSHPDCEAVPSKEDILYMIEGYSYPIISVYNGECSDIKSYVRISQTSDEIKEETLIKEN